MDILASNLIGAGGGGFPVNSLLALKYTEDRVDLKADGIWQKTGVVADDIQDFPLATKTYYDIDLTATSITLPDNQWAGYLLDPSDNTGRFYMMDPANEVAQKFEADGTQIFEVGATINLGSVLSAACYNLTYDSLRDRFYVAEWQTGLYRWWDSSWVNQGSQYPQGDRILNVMALTYDANLDIFMAGGNNYQINVVEGGTHKVLRSIKFDDVAGLYGLGSYAYGVTKHPDLDYIFFVTSNTKVVVMDYNTGEIIEVVDTGMTGLRSITFEDDKLVVYRYVGPTDQGLLKYPVKLGVGYQYAYIDEDNLVYTRIG